MTNLAGQAFGPKDTFEGGRNAAEERLRKLTELAIQKLTTEMLNTASYHIAVYLDVRSGQEDPAFENTKQMRDELQSERDNHARWNDEGSRLIQ